VESTPESNFIVVDKILMMQKCEDGATKHWYENIVERVDSGQALENVFHTTYFYTIITLFSGLNCVRKELANSNCLRDK
jgi:hypothetical protein